MNHHEIGSVIPSLARAKFQHWEVLHPMCRDYVIHLSRDLESLTVAQPKFIKIFLERLISLEYHRLPPLEHPSAALFFDQTRQVIALKRQEIETQLIEMLPASIEPVVRMLKDLEVCE